MSAFFIFQNPNDTIRIITVTARFFLLVLTFVIFEPETKKQKKGHKK